MAREVVTVALVIDVDDDEDVCHEDLLESIVANSDHIVSFDILDTRTVDGDDDE